MEMNKVPMAMNYGLALTNYRNFVNDKFPHDPSALSKNKRRLQNVKRKNDNNHQRSGGRNNNNNSNNQGNVERRTNNQGSASVNNRRDEWKVVGLDGRKIAVHPAYKLEPQVWANLPDQVKQQLIDMRRQYRENKRRRTTSQMESNSHFDGSNASMYSASYAGSYIPPPLLLK